MKKNVSMNVRVNSEVKKQAEETLAALGITLSDAFNMMLYQINLKKGLPFNLDTKKDYTMQSLSPRVQEHIEKYVSGADDLIGPFDNLDDLWESMDI